MPNLTIRSVGDGPKRTAVWLDGVPCIVQGFHEWPKVGEREFNHNISMLMNAL